MQERASYVVYNKYQGKKITHFLYVTGNCKKKKKNGYRNVESKTKLSLK